MKQRVIPFLVFIFFFSLFIGCTKDNGGKFEAVKPEPKVQVMKLVEDSPAIASMLENVDFNEFNAKTDELVSNNPEVIAQVVENLAGLMYDRPNDRSDDGKIPVLAQVTQELGESLNDFHFLYLTENLEDKFNVTLGIVDEIMNIKPELITDSTGSVLQLIYYLKIVSGVFEPGQDLARLDIDSIASGLETINDFYFKMEDASSEYDDFMSDNKDLPMDAIARSLMQALNEKDEAEINEMMEMTIEMTEDANGFSRRTVKTDPTKSKVQDLEEKAVNWLSLPKKDEYGDIIVDGTSEGALVNYAIEQVYPLLKLDKNVTVGGPEAVAKGLHPVMDVDHDGEDDYGNKVHFIDYGRYLLDVEAKILSKTYTDKNSKTQLFTRNLLADLNKDYKEYDHLQDVEIYNFNEPMMSWLKDTLSVYLAPTFGDGYDSTSGIKKSEFAELLWDGWTYDPSAAGSNTTFKGLLYSDDPEDIYNLAEDDGNLLRFAKIRSTDVREKPFRKMSNEKIGDFKSVSVAYGNNDVKKGETVLEAVVLNAQMHLYDQYFLKSEKNIGGQVYKNQWAWNAEDAKKFFGDENLCLSNFLGGLLTGGRNAMILNRYGKDPSQDVKPADADQDTWNMPLLVDLLYVMACAGGVAAPDVAPAELSMRNCLTANGGGMNMSSGCVTAAGMTLPVLGVEGMERKSSYQDGAGFVKYTTQADMPAMETMQPGTFRKRTSILRDDDNDAVDPTDLSLGDLLGGEVDHMDDYPTAAQLENNAEEYKIQGAFCPQQGDLIGVSGKGYSLETGGWAMAEIALACWEGYGPYTFRGKAPNGSKCKYMNDWYSDYYKIVGKYVAGETRGPGVGTGSLGSQTSNYSNGSRYHNWEMIYRPLSFNADLEIENEPAYLKADDVQDIDFNNDGDTLDEGEQNIPVYGYLRTNVLNENYYDNEKTVEIEQRVRLDCATREEAIRKNFYWLFNQKKYQFLIPIQTGLDHWLLGAVQIWCFATINANGIAGVSSASTSGKTDLSSGNGYWGKSGLKNNERRDIAGDENYPISTVATGETHNTVRFKLCSYVEQDYNISLDYSYTVDSWLNGIIRKIGNFPKTLWGTFGPNPVLPREVGSNFQPLITMANAEYSIGDLLTGDAEANNMAKFQKFVSSYYPEINTASLKDNEWPAIPKVKGVTYPTKFDANGNALEWTKWTKESTGKFDEMVALTGMLAGTMHEDGKIFKDDGSLATAEEVETRKFQYYAKDGYRTSFGDMVMMMAALNKSKKGSGFTPAYDKNFFFNRLIDFDPASGTVVPGSRKGLLPHVLQSQYTNLNYLDPVIDGANAAIRTAIRTYFNHFALSKGADNPTDNLPEYYLKGDEGQKIVGADGYYIVRDDVDWNIPLNRIRYFADARSLDQLCDVLDYVKEVSRTEDGDLDEQFVTFVKESIDAFNIYMKSENADWTEIELSSEQVKDYLNFVGELDYRSILKVVKDLELNDIEKLYNFDLNDFIDGTNEENLVKIENALDELNRSAVLYFGKGVKEAIFDGVYQVADGEYIDEDGLVFEENSFIFGKGGYIIDQEADISDDDRVEFVDLSSFIGDVTFDSDEQKYVVTGATDEVKVLWPGLRYWIDVKTDKFGSYDPKAMSYKDKFYHGGQVPCPNMLIFSNWDVNIPNVMDLASLGMLKLKPELFQYAENVDEEANFKHPNFLAGYDFGHKKDGHNVKYENYPYLPLASDFEDGEIKIYEDNFSAIEWIFALAKNSKAENFTNETDPFHFVKDFVFNSVYFAPIPETMELPEILLPDGEDRFVKTVISNCIKLLDENVFAYNDNHSAGYVAREFAIKDDLTDNKVATAHIIDVATQLIATAFNPDMKNVRISESNGWSYGDYKSKGIQHLEGNSLYVTEKMFSAVKEFGKVNISSDDLKSILDLTRALLVNRDNTPTYLLSSITQYLPDMLRQFDGLYPDLIDLGGLALEEGAVGDYLLDNVKLDSKYDAWDLINEFYLMTQMDVFKWYDSPQANQQTVWYQVGLLMDSLVNMIDSQVADYSNSTLPSKGNSENGGFELSGKALDLFTPAVQNTPVEGVGAKFSDGMRSIFY